MERERTSEVSGRETVGFAPAFRFIAVFSALLSYGYFPFHRIMNSFSFFLIFFFSSACRMSSLVLSLQGGDRGVGYHLWRICNWRCGTPVQSGGRKEMGERGLALWV